MTKEGEVYFLGAAGEDGRSCARCCTGASIQINAARVMTSITRADDADQGLIVGHDVQRGELKRRSDD